MIMFKMIMIIQYSDHLHDDNDSDNHNKRYDADDSGSMDAKELGRLLFTLIDNGLKVIDD